VHDELSEFARRAPEFEKLGVQLMGCRSTASTRHIAWIRNIEQNFGVKVKYPLIADLERRFAQKYGMIPPARAPPPPSVACSSSTTRNPQGDDLLSLDQRRSVEEVLRIVQSCSQQEAGGSHPRRLEAR